MDRAATERAIRLTMERRAELLAYARAIVRDGALVEDIFQEAVMVVIDKGSDVPEGEAFGHWFREVVRNVSMRALKKKNRDPRLMDPEMLRALEPAWVASALQGGRDVMGDLRLCLDKLSRKARQIILERYQNNLTGSRLAGRLGLTVNSAYATLTRVHRTLEACVRKAALEQGRNA